MGIPACIGNHSTQTRRAFRTGGQRLSLSPPSALASGARTHVSLSLSRGHFRESLVAHVCDARLHSSAPPPQVLPDPLPFAPARRAARLAAVPGCRQCGCEAARERQSGGRGSGGDAKEGSNAAELRWRQEPQVYLRGASLTHNSRAATAALAPNPTHFYPDLPALTPATLSAQPGTFLGAVSPIYDVLYGMAAGDPLGAHPG